MPGLPERHLRRAGGLLLLLRQDEDAGVESPGRGALVRRDLRPQPVEEGLPAQVHPALPSRLVPAVRGDGDQALRLRQDLADAPVQRAQAATVRLDMRQGPVVRQAPLRETVPPRGLRLLRQDYAAK